jgi:dihydroorotase
VRRAALRARDAGIRFDIGHGAGSFSFASAEALVRHDFWPDTISTDLHQISLPGPNLIEDQEIMPRIRGDGTPQLTLLTVMTKFLFLGMPLVEVIRATTIAPAEAIGRGNTLGTLTPGTAADVAILTVEQGPVDLVDIYDNRRQGDRALRSIRTFIAGRQLEPCPLPPTLPWIRLVEQEPDGARSEGSR